MSKKDIIFLGDDSTKFSVMLDDMGQAGRFSLNRSSISHLPGSWRIEPFRRNEDLHLLLVMEGRGVYYLGDDEYPLELRKGTLIFVGSAMAHSSRSYQPARLYISPVRFGMYDEAGKSLTEGRFPFAVVLENVNVGRYFSLFKRLNDLYVTGGHKKGQAVVVDGILRQIMGEMLMGLGQERDPRVSAALELIEQDIARRWTLTELAASCSLSTKHFTRLFVRIVGMPPGLFVRQLRIDQARLLLEDTAMSVREISEVLGYPDQFTFSKQFKSITGTSPGAIRRGQ